ncbi:hypothetical protein ABMA28_012773 [Loxostege sticticalis]|uniref:Uncharacterized protein n=2 Tax=Loxostege sticticalis TaxID=481309 RepID=A0ABD0S2I1_LOXSC
MATQRTPPDTSLRSGSGNSSGSAPNLTLVYDEEETNINNLIRKRKDRTHEHENKQDMMDFRSEIMNFLKNFQNTQSQNFDQIRQEISEVKEEIKKIKATTENLAENLNKISSEVQSIKSENVQIQDRISIIESDIAKIKNTQTDIDSQSSKTLFANHEELILEMKDRTDRERNIIFVGIKESSDKNPSVRRNYDMEMITQIATVLLGKYNPGKDRPVKVCYDNTHIPILLLRHKSKLPENVMIYADQTPAQKIYLQSIKDELKKRKDSGETDLIIKYIKNKPTIIKINSNKKN